eukprot:3059394-Alexandrium_andersonii.AAC.1
MQRRRRGSGLRMQHTRLTGAARNTPHLRATRSTRLRRSAGGEAVKMPTMAHAARTPIVRRRGGAR